VPGYRRSWEGIDLLISADISGKRVQVAKITKMSRGKAYKRWKENLWRRVQAKRKYTGDLRVGNAFTE